ncbi:MAG: hypothetical protein NWF04_05560 [Candidatus Bathyarchaeota archaeon]|nr:hypothetical protein [Candidatus Bathyarchaeota archaeon]
MGGDVSGIDREKTVTVKGNMSFNAVFAQNSYELIIISNGQGTVLPGNTTYFSGTIVDLKAINAEGWTFTGWNIGSTENTTLTMDSDKTITATFTQDTHTLTVVVNGQGTVTLGNSTYPTGTTVNLGAISDANWRFTGWSGDATGTEDTALVMNKDMTITATFAKNTYNVDFSVSGTSSDYTGTVLTVDETAYDVNDLPLSFTWDAGSQHTFEFNPALSVNSGKQYVWTSTSGLSNQVNAALTVTGAGNVVGTFETQYKLTVNTDYGTATGNGWYKARTTAQTTINPTTVTREGTTYVFNGWYGDITSSTAMVIMTMDLPKTLTANWTQQPQPTPTPTETPQPQTTPTPQGSEPADLGTVIALVTTSGENCTVGLCGNITSLQMTDVTITPDQEGTTTVLSFTVTGETGTQGFSNMTLSKADVPYGTTPVIYIDGEPVQEQGYTEDANNYYIWYTTSFSTHQITIQFTTQTNTIAQLPQEANNPFEIAPTALIIFIAAAIAITAWQKNKQPQTKE